MKNVLLLVAALLSVVAITVVATLAVVGEETADPLAVETTGLDAARDVGASTALPLFEAADERAEVTEPEEPTILESISVAELLPSELPTEAEIAAKYAAFEGEDFIGLAKARGMYYTKLASVIGERKVESGLCATRIIERSEPFGPILGEESWPGELPPVDTLKIDALEDGRVEIKHAQVFPDEDPKLHALYVEVEWLRKQAAPYQ